ncbi:YisL family protein [Amphibacillus jilinensis]|uniref:YisL family protein n=1 Tax=Amphibacillus jilinensis TaxID=1216008 RepID=UPI0002EB0B4C|nr:YisL family protein [Amphibacillus jilinensis]
MWNETDKGGDLIFYIHLHVISWLLAIILFAVNGSLYKKQKWKSGKITHMVSRVLYLLIIFTGVVLLYRYTQANVWNDYGPEVIIKSIAGLWVVVMMESIILRIKKDAPFKGFMVQWIVMLVIALVLGFGRLPWGFLPL